MKKSTACPCCEERITLRESLRATTPLRLTCGHCRARLRVELAGVRLAFALILVSYLALFTSLLVAFLRRQVAEVLVLVGATILFAAVSEITVGLWILNRARLTVHNRPTRPGCP